MSTNTPHDDDTLARYFVVRHRFEDGPAASANGPARRPLLAVVGNHERLGDVLRRSGLPSDLGHASPTSLPRIFWRLEEAALFDRTEPGVYTLYECRMRDGRVGVFRVTPDGFHGVGHETHGKDGGWLPGPRETEPDDVTWSIR